MIFNLHFTRCSPHQKPGRISGKSAASFCGVITVGG
jgi:hypothetical protein